MLFVIAAGSMTLFSGQLVLSPLLPTIIASLSITSTQAGVALSVMRGLVALCRYPGGRMADQLSRKTVLVASYAIAIAGFAVLLFAETYPSFLLGAAIVGVGAGLYMPAALTQLSATFVARRGRAFGVHEIAINLGGVLAGTLAVAVIVIGSWNAAFVPVIAALFGIGGLMHRWNDENYVLSGAVEFDLRATGARVFRDRRILAMLVAFSVMAFTWQGMASFLTTLLQGEKGFSAAFAGNAFTGLFLVGIVANLVVTPLGDRFGYERTALGSVVLCVVGLSALVVTHSAGSILAGIAIFGLGSASFWPLMMSAVMDVLPSDSMGGDYGVISMTFMAVGSLGSTYVGIVAEWTSYTAAYAGLVGGLLVVLMVVYWLARRLR